MNLALQEAKTAITPFDVGFRFLGGRFGGGFDDELLADPALEKTCYVRNLDGWIGVDHDALTVREGKRLVARLPLRRVRELVVFGAAGVSTRLVQRCAERGIPVGFCAPGGRFQNLLWRPERVHYRLAAAHARKHEALPEVHRLAWARALVVAKRANYATWLRTLPGEEPRKVLETIEAGQRLLTGAETVEAVRGVEGMVAKETFRLVNGRAPEAFRSERREPGLAFDRWNALLDFAYTLLFHRLHVLLRVRGLDPFLGILHSARAPYESLVCDLQEPFRARCDRWVLKLVNRQQIGPDDFVKSPPAGPYLAGAAVGRFLEWFAQELDTRLAAEPASWLRLIEAQVRSVQRWVEFDEPFRVFQALLPEEPGNPVEAGEAEDE